MTRPVITPTWSLIYAPRKESSTYGCCRGRTFRQRPRSQPGIAMCGPRQGYPACFLLLGEILKTPGFAARLFEALRPASGRRGLGGGDDLAYFYLICFALGIAFSVLSFFFGGHLLAFAISYSFGRGAPTERLHGSDASRTHSHRLAFMNPPTVAAFLAWFGGAGFLLTRFSAIWVVTGFGLAAFAGLVGASIIFLFMTRC